MTEKAHGKFLEDHGKYLWKWNLKHLGYIVDIYMEKRWMSTLAKGFAIFQPVSMFLIFHLQLWDLDEKNIKKYIYVHLNLSNGGIKTRWKELTVASLRLSFEWLMEKCTMYSSDVLIIRNNRLINRKSCWLWWSILIFNNRLLDACTKNIYMHNKATRQWSLWTR